MGRRLSEPPGASALRGVRRRCSGGPASQYRAPTRPRRRAVVSQLVADGQRGGRPCGTAHAGSSAGAASPVPSDERWRPTCSPAPLETADWPLAMAGKHGAGRRGAVLTRRRDLPQRVLTGLPQNPPRPNAACFGGGPTRTRKFGCGADVTICSRGGEAVTGVGGASVGPVDPRIHCGPRFRAHRHHLVVGLAARRRGQHAPLPRDERRRWGLSDASPSCGAEICSRATATVRRGKSPRHPP